LKYSTPFNQFVGLIDEVKLYNTSLSANEITGVIEETNFAPSDIKLSSNVLLNSSSTKNTPIGELLAVDNLLDEGKHTYTLVNDADGLFAIDPATKSLVLNDPSKLDYENNPNPTIRVRATDPAKNIFEKDFTIQLLPVEQDSSNSGLIAYYKIDEKDNATYKLVAGDSSGITSTSTAFYTGSRNPVTQILGNGPIRNKGGIYGTSASFSDGNYINLGSQEIRFNDQFTVSAWIKPTDFNGSQGILAIDEVTDIYAKGFSFSLKDKNLWLKNEDGGSGAFFPLPNDVFANQWIHVAATYKDHVETLYVNGSAIGSLKLDKFFLEDANNPDNLDYLIGSLRSTGGWGSNQRLFGYDAFKGQIDEVRFYNQALSKDQLVGIIEKYNSGPQDITINSNVIIDDAANGTVIGQLDSLGISLDKGK
jgi:hypothetical protein